MEEKQVLVNESSLVNIADALRDKLGDTKKVPSVVQNPLPFIQKTSGATGHDYLGRYANVASAYQVYTIPGASSILIKCSADVSSSSCVIEGKGGEHSSWTYGTVLNSPYSVGTKVYKETIFEDTDTITIKVYYNMAYYMEICGLDADGNEMPYYETESEVEVANTFKPNEMAEAINNISGQHFAYIKVSDSSPNLITKQYIDISQYIGTNDNRPFSFVFSAYTSGGSGYGSGFTVVTYYDGAKFNIVGSNIALDGSTFSNITSAFQPTLEQGVLGLFSKSNLHLNNSRYSPSYMTLIY